MNYVLQPMPEYRTESGAPPDAPGTEHGQYGPALRIESGGGYSSVTSTGFWRWCGDCGAWQKGVAILGVICCPTCRALWRRP